MKKLFPLLLCLSLTFFTVARASKPTHGFAPETDTKALVDGTDTVDEAASDDDDSTEDASSDEGEDMNDDNTGDAANDENTGEDDGNDDAGDDGGDEGK